MSKNNVLLLLYAISVPTIAEVTIYQDDTVPTMVHTTPMPAVATISDFFSQPGHKVNIQFPSNETRYVWQQMSRFYPTAQILRDGEIKTLPIALNAEIGKIKATVETKTQTLDQHLDQHLDQYPVDAFIVVQQGNIIFERYNTMRPIDKHNWFSSGKIIGATLLAMLEAEHRVELNKPVSDYLLELQGSVWDTVTVRDTVNMTTGLDCTEHDEPTRDARTNPQQCWFKWAASLNLAPTDDTTTTPMAVLREMQRRQPANQAFEYNSINTFVINRVVESVTHTPINELFSDKIWSKIGAQADGYVATSPQGYAMHFFGTNSNLRDMARFGMAFTASGNYIVPKAVVSDMQQSGNPAIYAKGHVGQLMMVSFPGESLTNGYQWDAIFSDGDMFKSGVGGQGIYVSPATDTVIAWFSSGTGRHQEQTFARAIAKQLSE